MDMFSKERNEGGNLLHINNKTNNQQYNWNFLKGFKDLK